MGIREDLTTALVPIADKYHPAEFAQALLQLAAALISDNCPETLFSEVAEKYEHSFVEALAYYRANPIHKMPLSKLN